MERILIVDDEPSVRRLLAATLTSAGYEISQAANGDEGFRKTLEEKPDLIIADVLMPVKDGYTLAKDLRNEPVSASIPIIMLTGLKKEQDELKAFQEGVDDYIIKPVSLSVLRARVAALLARASAFRGEKETVSPQEKEHTPGLVASGCKALDEALGGGMRPGTNVLLVGTTGSGKSTLGRCFIAAGLHSRQHSMMITLDDEPAMIRQSLDNLLPKTASQYEQEGFLTLVDGYSWSRGSIGSNERFAVSGVLELNQLAGIIADAGRELGQSPDGKAGGCRVFDSISSLFINFELASVQRLVAQLARTATSYGGVTTLFIVEEGAVPEQTLNNVKYVMDGLIETKLENERYYVRIANMKWAKFSPAWVEVKE